MKPEESKPEVEMKAVKEDTKAVEPKAEPKVRPVEKAPEFYFDEAGLLSINNFLALAGDSETAGVLDYKPAFHKLITLVRGSLKQR